MSKYLIKGKRFLSYRIWFEVPKELPKCDYVLLYGVAETDIGKINKISSKVAQSTLCTDLAEDENVIFSKFSSTVRNEINRSEKDGVKTIIFESSELKQNRETVEAFSEMYSAMYKEKGMKESLNINELNSYIENGDLLLTAVYTDNTPLIFHSYIKNGQNARLLHSCSEFRVSDKGMRNFIGRANKYLHWTDMLYLKSEGVTNYDWGGIHSFEEPNGIDKFKMAFGGERKEYYNLWVYKSLKAKIYNFIKNMFSKGN